MIAIHNADAVDKNVRFAEIIRRMTRRIEDGHAQSAAKLGKAAWNAAKIAGIETRDWDSRFDEG